MQSSRQPIWDLATRLYHWLLVLCLPLAWWSAEQQNFDVHQWVGYTVLVLIVARIIWGFIGSHYSRFSQFLAGPRKVKAYLSGREMVTAGHNPLGGWSVITLLTLLLMQAVSGLFNSDDILFSGPFYYAASDELQNTMGLVHDLAFNVLLGCVALHVLAVSYYQFKGGKIIQAMLNGGEASPAGNPTPAPFWWWLLVTSVLAALLWWAIQRAPQPTAWW